MKDLFSLISIEEDWKKYWQDMPDFFMGDVKPSSVLNVQFTTEEDRADFLQMLGFRPDRKKSIWWPSQEYLSQSERNAPAVNVEPNKYPVYIISKGRWENPLTIRSLEKLGIDFHVVIEPQEYNQYESAVSPDNILVLPFSNLGQGSIPARNWVWEHSIQAGHERHWIVDDNIDGFYRLNNNLKRKVIDENPFIACEQFTDRFSNVPMSGLNYEFLVDRRSKSAPFRLNTRIYSCILLSNDKQYFDFRWRGRYNEDTDLSIRFLKAGFCTILFNAFLAKKNADNDYVRRQH